MFLPIVEVVLMNLRIQDRGEQTHPSQQTITLFFTVDFEMSAAFDTSGLSAADPLEGRE